MSPTGQRSSGNAGVTAGIVVASIALVAVIGLIAWLAFMRQPTTTPERTPTEGTSAPTPASSTPVATTPSNEPTATPSGPGSTPVPPSTSVEPTSETTMQWQGKAEFEHFSVELMPEGDGVSTIEGAAGFYVEVCVLSALPEGDSGKTLITSQPWRLEDSTGTRRSPRPQGAYEPPFPATGHYDVGQCATGWLTFDALEGPIDFSTLVYENGLGDKAVWQFH